MKVVAAATKVPVLDPACDKVAPERYALWETGDEKPTLNQARVLCRVLRRPLAVFLLPRPPKGFSTPRDFRAAAGVVRREPTAALLREVRLAHDRRELALDLCHALGVHLPAIKSAGSIDTDSVLVAARVREAVGLKPGEIPSSSDERDAFNTWRNRIEAAGVIVFQASGIPMAELRRFSIAHRPLPVIVVNTKDSLYGRIFTMVHELAHILVRQDGLCDLVDDAHLPPEERRIEVFCNRVAAEVLMPESTFLADTGVATHVGLEWTDAEIASLSRQFRVSREAIVRRLLTFRKTTRAFYESKRRQYAQEAAQFRAAAGDAIVTPDRMAVSTAGRFYTRLVVDGYRQEKLTGNELSDYLNVRIKHLPKIERAILPVRTPPGLAR